MSLTSCPGTDASVRGSWTSVTSAVALWVLCSHKLCVEGVAFDEAAASSAPAGGAACLFYLAPPMKLLNYL